MPEPAKTVSAPAHMPPPSAEMLPRMPDSGRASPEPTQRVATRKFKPLQEARLFGREFKQNVWAVFAENGTTIETLLTREFWAHQAARLHSFDKICVMTDDKRLYVELVVTATGSNWAQVHVFGTPLIVGQVASRGSIADDYRIEDGGLYNQWQIVRNSDNAIIKGDGTLKTEDAARQWLRDFLNSQGLRTAA